MRVAVIACGLLAAVAAPALSAAVPAWTEAVQREYEQVLAEARQQRWQSPPGAQVSLRGCSGRGQGMGRVASELSVSGNRVHWSLGTSSGAGSPAGDL